MMGCCNQPPLTGWRKWYHGARGIVRSFMHRNRSAPDLITLRVRECLGNGPDKPPCEYSGAGWSCAKCGCVIALKIRNKDEHCPAGKW